MLPTFNNPWQFLCWFGREILKTFSNQPSFFSSKRIERALIFVNANVVLDLCVNELVKQGKIDELGAVAIYTAQMIYAGYQTKQIFNEKPKTTINSDGLKDEDVTSTEITENK